MNWYWRILRSLLILICLFFTLETSYALALTRKESFSASPIQIEKASELVFPDYLQRSKIISTYEAEIRQTPDSSLLLRLLAGQYLKRFRERADVEDLLRAEQASRQALSLQNHRDRSSSMILASTLLSQHRFQAALEAIAEAQKFAPDDVNLVALSASIQMELGHYDATHHLLQMLTQKTEDSGHSAVLARYLELTGNLAEARVLMNAAMQQMDAFYSNSAETRAWFHVRAGDLSFAAGQLALAEQRYQEALNLFPQDVAAFTGLARLYAAQHRWQDALEVANRGIEWVPLLEILAYKADAQKALGDSEGVVETEGLMEVVAHLSKVQGIYDRALAMYYVDHGIHIPEALEIARREVLVRDDIYAEDTLAWAAAANHRWTEAQQAAKRATRLGTEDALILFHSGMIALNCGDRPSAFQHLTQALKLNPKFHHRYAEEARQVLSSLASVSVQSNRSTSSYHS
jgi:tetratricopeptide (TPR) repeat protein